MAMISFRATVGDLQTMDLINYLYSFWTRATNLSSVSWHHSVARKELSWLFLGCQALSTSSQYPGSLQ